MSDRRTFLHGLASLPLAGTSLALLCGTAAASPADTDAELLALGREWRAAADHLDRTYDALDSVEERRCEIDPPEALFRRRSDGIAFTSLAYQFLETQQLWYPPIAVEQLRTDEFVNPWGDPLVRDRARRDEIVAAHDTWKAEIAAHEQAIGYTAASAANNAAAEVARRLRVHIRAKPAVTVAGVMVKVRIIERAYGGLTELRAELEHSIGKGASDADAMASSAVVDLLTMQAAAA